MAGTFFQHFEYIIYTILACTISAENSTDCLVEVPIIFSLAAFRILSLSLIFEVLLYCVLKKFVLRGDKGVIY